MVAFDRKLRRTTAKKVAKRFKKNMPDILAEAMKAKMESYSKIPDSCIACDKPFDKKDREQVFSWTLQVYEEEEIYNLFCPECHRKHSEEQAEEETINE